MEEQDDTVYLTEAGLYSLILKSNKPKADKFSNWVVEDVLPSIRKQGYYNLLKKFNLEDYNMRNCFYIFKCSGSFFKLGITNNIKSRMSSHKSDGLLKNESQIVEIFTFDNYTNLMDLEREIKNFIRDNGYSYEFKNYTELFKEEAYEIILKKIKELINKTNLTKELNFEQSASQTSIEILKLQNDKIKNELELEKVKLSQIEKEIELEKIKQLNKVVVNKVINNNNNTINNITNVSDKSDKSDKSNKSKKCIDCDNLIKKSSTRCNYCENKSRFLKGNGKRPTFEQLLKDKIELGSYTKIGRKYDVSDNAVRKWFNTYKKYGFKFNIVKEINK